MLLSLTVCNFRIIDYFRRLQLNFAQSMPTYDYQCQACGHTWELFQSMNDKPVNHVPNVKTQSKTLTWHGCRANLQRYRILRDRLQKYRWRRERKVPVIPNLRFFQIFDTSDSSKSSGKSTSSSSDSSSPSTKKESKNHPIPKKPKISSPELPRL